MSTTTRPNSPVQDLEDQPFPTQELPPGFYEHLAHALGTADPDLLGAAETGYRGTFPSAHHYILATLAEQLPTAFSWLRECLDPDLTLTRYEAGRLAVWTIRLDGEQVMVFESSRVGRGPTYTVPYCGDRLRVFADL